MTDDPTLFEWAGGAPAFRRLIDAFYDRTESDELISPLFPGGVSEEHRAHVTLWWIEVFGGPADYTGRLGGYERMLAHHRDLGITPEQRFRFASLMSWPPTTRGCPTIRSFGLRSSATSSGVRGWPCRTHSPAPRSCPRRRCRTGAGVWRRRTSPDR